MTTGNEHVQRAYARLARSYDRQMGVFERLLFAGSRAWAVRQANGQVLEIGVGTGLNLPYYPAGTAVLGVDLSEQMLVRARERARHLGISDRVELCAGDAQRLELSDASVDVVVSTFTFCTIPDPAAAAREAYRVLRPGGIFVSAEHGPSSRRWLTALMRGVEHLAYRFDADHLTRDPVTYLRDAGFETETVTRAKAGISFRVRARKAP